MEGGEEAGPYPEDLGALSVKELKQRLAAAGVQERCVNACTEKCELVELLRQSVSGGGGDGGGERDVAKKNKSATSKSGGQQQIEDALPNGGFICEHYMRKCRLVAACCGEVFPCRHCHNNSTTLRPKGHEIDRKATAEVVCEVCKLRQPVAQDCVQCSVRMGEYFCPVCVFYDDEGEKKGTFHCDKCQICRVGGQENFFHCDKCCMCYAMSLQDNHRCVENSFQSNCPVCLEFLHGSREAATSE
jgi:hypothetical protein